MDNRPAPSRVEGWSRWAARPCVEPVPRKIRSHTSYLAWTTTPTQRRVADKSNKIPVLSSLLTRYLVDGSRWQVPEAEAAAVGTGVLLLSSLIDPGVLSTHGGGRMVIADKGDDPAQRGGVFRRRGCEGRSSTCWP